jgi:hypothetical protein
MKDWKAEYDKLKGQYEELRKEVQWLRQCQQDRLNRADELRDNFKTLLIDVLGR